MTVFFFDRQDTTNPSQGAKIESPEWLLARLSELQQRPPSFCELEAENGYSLLLGVGPERGCVQFSGTDGSRPYLMALADDDRDDEEYMEFLTANTDTPIPRRYCLPMDEIRQISSVFLTTGQRSGSVTWEEV